MQAIFNQFVPQLVEVLREGYTYNSIARLLEEGGVRGRKGAVLTGQAFTALLHAQGRMLRRRW